MALLLTALLAACSTAVQGAPVAAPELTAPVPITKAWKREVTTAVAAIGTALGATGDAMVEGRFFEVRQGCRDLKAATDELEDQLPSEDEDVNAALQNAVDEYRSFAEQCSTLNATASAAQLDRLEDTLDRADGSVREAMALLGIPMPGR